MLKTFKADLHIHTCLSPCGDLKMTPQKIINQVLENNLDIIAICDHNTAENVPALINAAKDKNVVVLPGMEICTREEIHVLALFENLELVFEMQAKVYEKLHGKNNPDVFGLQVIGNEFDEVLGFNDKLLIGAVDLSVEEIVNRVHKLGGLAIASHIDRESYSVISQLGFIPNSLEFDALEISPSISCEDARKKFPVYQNYTFIQNSDAHFLNDIGKASTSLLLAEATFDEIKKALKDEDKRKIQNPKSKI
ncbi:MAG: PHP domain-containing protein [Bacteroidota bacterium]|nr:PHP domain-containing protein [Bacteroidota bacterium]